MMYCKRCGKLHTNEASQCENCGKNLYKVDKLNTPSYLVTACGFERSGIEGALKDNNIVFLEKPEKNETGANAITGSYSENHRILVPFQAYAKAREIICGLGMEADCFASDETFESEIESLKVTDPGQVAGEPSKKLTAVMMFVFLLIIMAAVFFTDGIMEWIKQLLS